MSVPYRENLAAAVLELGAFPGLSDEDLTKLYVSAAASDEWEIVDALADEIDRRHPYNPGPSERLRAVTALGNSARFYARRGVAVFPLAPGAKIPRKGSAGFKDATTDLEQVERWWAAEPASNIGAPTGLDGPGGFDVVDVDGLPGWRTIFDSGLELPPLIGRARTARPGGWHLFIAPTGSGNRARMGGAAGLDYRGAGGYVVLAPSRLRTERGLSFYQWIEPLEVLR